MKRRITCLILVVVMLALSLASCGYSYVKDDLSQYATFDKAAFEAAIGALKIEDGEYAESKRDAMQLDTINEALAKKADTDAKLEVGVIDANDKVYYCYYVTFTNDDGETVTLVPTYMQSSKAVNLQVGLSDHEKYQKALSDKLAEGTTNIEDYLYKVKTTGASVKGDIAYISYVVSTKGTDAKNDVTVTYEKVVLGDETHDVAAKLVGGTIGGSAIAAFDSTDGTKSYSNAKINWVVDVTEENPYNEIVLDPVVMYDKTTKQKDVFGTEYDLKDKELTYHICPTYFLDVEDFSAEAILRTLTTSLTKDSYECLKECEDLIKTFNDELKVYNEKVTAVEDAEKAVTKAEEQVDKVVDAVPEGEDVEANKSVIEAKKALEDAKTKEAEAVKAKEDADAKVVAAMSAIFKKVGADDEAKGKTTLIDEYKENTHDTLLATYNSEIKTNLAKAVWEAMKAATKVNSVPAKAVDEIYDRMIESYKYDFHTGDYNSTNKISNWEQYNGNFEKFLIVETEIKTDSYKDAEAHVRQEASDYVKDFVIIYYVAEIYGLTYTDAELKEYKKDESGDYEYYVYQQGEMNTLAAFQFDKMLDFFLESETDEETGKVTYKHELVSKFTIKTEDDKKDETTESGN